MYGIGILAGYQDGGYHPFREMTVQEAVVSFVKAYRYIEEQTGVASNYCNYMNTQTKNPFEIEHIITDHYEWFTSEYSDQEEFRRWRNSFGALLLLHKSINASLNDSKYDYKLSKYCSNEGNI